MGSVGVEAIAGLLTTLTALVSLGVSNTRVNSRHAVELCAAMQAHPSLTELDFGKNEIGECVRA